MKANKFGALDKGKNYLYNNNMLVAYDVNNK